MTDGFHTPRELRIGYDYSRLETLPIELQEQILDGMSLSQLDDYCKAFPLARLCESNSRSPIWRRAKMKALYDRYTDLPLPAGKSHEQMVNFFRSLADLERASTPDVYYGWEPLLTYRTSRIEKLILLVASLFYPFTDWCVRETGFTRVNIEIVRRMLDMYPNNELLQTLFELMSEELELSRNNIDIFDPERIRNAQRSHEVAKDMRRRNPVGFFEQVDTFVRSYKEPKPHAWPEL